MKTYQDKGGGSRNIYSNAEVNVFYDVAKSCVIHQTDICVMKLIAIGVYACALYFILGAAQ
ncbi:hypothetical protein [Lelliottia sp. WB101]|uniref:hypothetical protein n=1 Tax=Lelliottia sp. WB101 TaxID=2153385 RepID=UPI00131EEAE2|nr:hypothetical protein [Lelliottia sp. WB101]